MGYPKNRISRKTYRPYTNKEWFYEQYIVLNKTATQIAQETGCTKNTIIDWIRRHDLRKNPKTHGTTVKYQYQDRNYLYTEAVIKNRFTIDIAKDNNVRTSTIKLWLNKYNLPYKPKTPNDMIIPVDEGLIINLYNDKKSMNEISKITNCNRNKIKKILLKHHIEVRDLSEAQFAISGKEKPSELNYDWLYQHYVVLHQNSREIGEILGINPTAVRYNMRIYGVPIRNESESKIGVMVGENHPNWKGGKTPLDLLLREYFNVNLAPIAVKRDEYTCQKCGAQHTILHVHHIIHFKDIVDQIISEHPEININDNNGRQQMYNIIVNDDRFLDINNLITLCKTCHQNIHSTKTISSQASLEEGSETIENHTGE